MLTFSEKFDLLMNLTATSNSALAKYMALDPSYISRLRRGERSLPRNTDYPAQFSTFFIRQCTASYQREALCRALDIPQAGAFDDTVSLSDTLLAWLIGPDTTMPVDPVAGLLTDFSRISASHAPKKQSAQREENDVMVFYGDEGRRQATTTLFNLALQQPGPISLLLYSDESSSWMTESSNFRYEWSSLLWQIILRGSRVRIIHKISNDIDEMLEVVRQWLPFYASGAIEPFYYPKLRDGVYKRTLSVVPGVAAVFATSIGDQANAASTFMATDRQTIDSFTNEFSSYLALCRPLIRIHTLRVPDSDQVLQYFITHTTSSILKSDGLSLATLPNEALRLIGERATAEIANAFYDLHHTWSTNMENSLAQNEVCHILRLADPADVLAGRVAISCVGLCSAETLFYTPHEYCLHLHNLLSLLEHNPRFSILLDDGPRADYSLHAFEEGEVFIFKESPPFFIFQIAEANMTSAFWDYMKRLRSVQERTTDRAAVIQQLQAAIAALQ